jgi:hypothetical protein
MKPERTSRSSIGRRPARSVPRPPRRDGFTLLELIFAFTLLTLFVLPMLELVYEARVRSHEYTRKREIQDLAQRQLFDRIYFYSEDVVSAGSMTDMRGDFAQVGHPDWTWEIPYPQIVNQGEQVLLEYTIRVFVPQLGDKSITSTSSSGGLGGLSASSLSSSLGSFGSSYTGAAQPSYELTTWTFPSEYWYDEQQALMDQGLDTGYYGGSGW